MKILITKTVCCFIFLISVSTFVFGEMLPFSDERIVEEVDLMGLSKKELRIARNEIFARYGYAFKSKDLLEHFSQYEWYDPKTKKVNLSSIESKNVKFIKSYETDDSLRDRLKKKQVTLNNETDEAKKTVKKNTTQPKIKKFEIGNLVKIKGSDVVGMVYEIFGKEIFVITDNNIKNKFESDKLTLINDPKVIEEFSISLQKTKEEEKEKQNKEKEELEAKLKKEKEELEVKLKKEKEEKEKKLKEFNSERLLRVETNYGFRDIKPGMLYEEVIKVSGCALNEATYTKCYGLDNYKFSGAFNSEYVADENHMILTDLYIDLGPIVSGGFMSDLSISKDAESGNIFTKMRNILDSKYSIDFSFSDRDRQLFNEGEKMVLLTVYEKGQVTLRINRVKKDEYSTENRLYVEYRDIQPGKSFLEENKPKKASASDF